MPMIRIEWLPGRTVEQKIEMADVLTREVCRIARCKPTDVSLIFEEVSAENWAVSGRLFSDSYE